MARKVFQTRRVMTSVDVYGRHSPIDTGAMSPETYAKLLDAALRPLRLDGPDLPVKAEETPVSARLARASRIGPECGLPIPDWWETPEPGMGGALDLPAMIQRNMERAATKTRRGGGPWN